MIVAIRFLHSSSQFGMFLGFTQVNKDFAVAIVVSHHSFSPVQSRAPRDTCDRTLCFTRTRARTVDIGGSDTSDTPGFISGLLILFGGRRSRARRGCDAVDDRVLRGSGRSSFSTLPARLLGSPRQTIKTNAASSTRRPGNQQRSQIVQRLRNAIGIERFFVNRQRTLIQRFGIGIAT